MKVETEMCWFLILIPGVNADPFLSGTKKWLEEERMFRVGDRGILSIINDPVFSDRFVLSAEKIRWRYSIIGLEFINYSFLAPA